LRSDVSTLKATETQHQINLTPFPALKKLAAFTKLLTIFGLRVYAIVGNDIFVILVNIN
jgi:hypothetical protein